MATIHTIVQGKGVGKTIIAGLLVQYLRDERGQTVLCLDTDTLNASLSNFTALQAKQVEIADLTAHCHTIPQEIAHVAIDTSTAGYLPFCSQMQDKFLPALTEAGHILHMHTVVTGGQPALETFNGFRSLASNFPMLPLTVWLNPFYGPLELQGKSFEESRVYQEYSASVHALVRLPENSQFPQKDFQTMLAKHLTFKAALRGGNGLFIVQMSRLNRIRHHRYHQDGAGCQIKSELLQIKGGSAMPLPPLNFSFLHPSSQDAPKSLILS